METFIGWVLTTWGMPGALAIGGFFVWRDLKNEQAASEKRYIDLIDRTIEGQEAGREKYVDLATTTIKSLGDVHASHQRLRDLIDERCPRNGGR